jgi:hypothetical protein
MHMDVAESISQLDLQSESVAFAIIVIAVLLILHINRHRLQTAYREWRMQRCLNKIGVEQIRDLVCPDGLDGYYHIDRLALTPDAILLIAYKPFVGNIYCAERIAEWTQVIGRKSFKFANPLFELENQITALTLALGSIPLRGCLLFSNSTIFPKGHPESVLQPETIPTQYRRDPHVPIGEEVQAAWEHLKWQQANGAGGGRLGVKA